MNILKISIRWQELIGSFTRFQSKLTGEPGRVSVILWVQLIFMKFKYVEEKMFSSEGHGFESLR